MADTAANLGTTMFSGHKHTNRSLPINNKICNQRWVDRCQQLHRMRLNQIKPAIGMPDTVLRNSLKLDPETSPSGRHESLLPDIAIT